MYYRESITNLILNITIQLHYLMFGENLEKRTGFKFTIPHIDTNYKYVPENTQPILNKYYSIDDIVSHNCDNSIPLKYDLLCLLIVFITFSWFISTLDIIKM